MKSLLASLAFLAAATNAWAGSAPVQTPAPWKVAGLTCGFKPFKPFECRNGDAVCVCDGSGNCSWVWVGC